MKRMCVSIFPFYRFKLFLKLFLIMGSIWSFDIVLCWIYNNGEQVPWYIFILDGMMFLQALAIFIIFCCNRRTLKNLEEKFPIFKREYLSQGIRRFNKMWLTMLRNFCSNKKIAKNTRRKWSRYDGYYPEYTCRVKKNVNSELVNGRNFRETQNLAYYYTVFQKALQ
jgi:hypothetical protein